MSITDLSSYRQTKLNKKILEDINNILLVIDKSGQAFSYFQQYPAVREMISMLEANKNLFEMYKKKYEKESKGS